MGLLKEDSAKGSHVLNSTAVHWSIQIADYNSVYRVEADTPCVPRPILLTYKEMHHILCHFCFSRGVSFRFIFKVILLILSIWAGMPESSVWVSLSTWTFVSWKHWQKYLGNSRTTPTPCAFLASKTQFPCPDNSVSGFGGTTPVWALGVPCPQKPYSQADVKVTIFASGNNRQHPEFSWG